MCQLFVTYVVTKSCICCVVSYVCCHLCIACVCCKSLHICYSKSMSVTAMYVLQTCMLQPCVCYRRVCYSRVCYRRVCYSHVCYRCVCYSHVCVTDVPGSVGVVSASPGLRRKLRRCDVLGPGGDSVEPAPLPVVQLTKPLLYSPSLQRKVVSSSTLSSLSTCSSVTDSSSDDSRLSKAVASSQRTETDDSDSVSESVRDRDRDDSGVTTDDSHDTETDHSRQPRYV